MKNSKWGFYKILCLFTGVLFVYLFFTLFLNSKNFLIDLGLDASEAAIVLTRRAAMFMLGISVLMFGSFKLTHSHARQMICVATGVSMLGLSIMGAYELNKGTVNSSILVAIVIETILWLSFGFVFFKNRAVKVSSGAF